MKRTCATFALLFLALPASLGAQLGGWEFARQHLDALFLASAVVASAVALAVGAITLLARKRQRATSAGAISAEFVIVIIPFLMALFGLMQIGVASMARLEVCHAAFAAARAAIVVVPTSVGSESENQVGTGGGSGASVFANSKKMDSIRNAAAYALIPASPALQTFTKVITNHGTSVDRALDASAGGSIERSLSKLIYAKMATAVTLRDENDKIKTSFTNNGQIRAKVTYLFPCQFPLINRLVGKSGFQLPQDASDELEANSESAALKALPAYYMVLTAEHQLTNQGAKP